MQPRKKIIITIQQIECKKSRRRITWRPLPGQWLKANVDATYRTKISEGVSTVVVRDSTGKLMTGVYAKFKTASSLAAEAERIRNALILTKNLQLEKILIESDCLPLTQAIKAKNGICEMDPILRDIQELARNIRECGFTWSLKEGNELAHQVAKATSSNELGIGCAWNPPPPIESIMTRERKRE
ncbi:hypothetical protein AHAS_Ahas04G0177200 [Arachis hypogaea]